MGEVTPFSSIMEAGNHAKALVAGNFSLEGQDATEGSQQLVTSFNNFWEPHPVLALNPRRLAPLLHPPASLAEVLKV